ncbi:hypothetical protein E2C01_039647 [Portunus trituberculatus]|uniref:Uncharacterized protein n=1 Tax=Portunus trituberculatus TaxID=210409 RepID=A0A5B7FF97_PORTR|nr:hypothetical protein [Portunus trituberculatus]
MAGSHDLLSVSCCHARLTGGWGGAFTFTNTRHAITFSFDNAASSGPTGLLRSAIYERFIE